MITNVCGWCKRMYDSKKIAYGKKVVFLGQVAVSHGMCRDCYQAELRKVMEFVEESVSSC